VKLHTLLLALIVSLFGLARSAFGDQPAVKFSANLGLNTGESAERGLIGVQNGKYYLGSYSGKLLVVNGNDGSLVCSYSTDGPVHSNIVFDSSGTYYFVSRDMYLYALNDDCTLKWKGVIENEGWTVAISPDKTTIYATGGKYLHAFDRNGQLKWSKNVGPWVEIGFVGQDGTIYVSSQDQYIRAYDAQGNVKWQYLTQGYNPRLSGPTANGLLIAAPGYPDRWIYGIDTSNGNLKWRVPLTTYGGSAASDDEYIYVVNGKQLHALAPETGNTVWSTVYDENATSVDSANSLISLGSDGYIYFSTTESTTSSLFAFNKTGSLLAKYSPSRPGVIEAKNAAPGGGVFITYNGYLQIRSVQAVNSSDCLFNWAEATYSTLLQPTGATSATLGDYYYRYYSTSQAYLATNSVDNHLYYLGPASNNEIFDLGQTSGWLTQAGCQ